MINFDKILDDYWINCPNDAKAKEYIKKAIRQCIPIILEEVADNAQTKEEETYAGSLGNEEGKLYDTIIVVDKNSILSLKDTLIKQLLNE